MSNSDEHVNRNLSPENAGKNHFPEGLRVLAVDDNVVCLKLLAALLQKCRYQVTTTTKATEAIEMLRKHKENYDIVITDLVMLDMDGFELLEIIGLEMDIPVIITSAKDETESVMKGVMHGARDYLVKPVRIEELQNIWQHVIRKGLSDPRKSNITKEEADEISMQLKRPREETVVKEEEMDTNTRSNGEPCAQKKPRMAWTPALHKNFVSVVQRLGVDKAVPKKILELMNEPQLSRENVASHLQKYRNLLKKEKNKTSTSRDSNSNVNLNRTGGSGGIVPFNSQGRRHAINHIGGHLRSNAEMVSSHHRHFTRPEMFDTPCMNPRPLFLTPNPQEMSLQQNRLSPAIGGHMRPAAMPMTLLRNVPRAPALMENTQLHLPHNAMAHHSNIPSWRKVGTDGYDLSSQVARFASGQPGPSAQQFVGFASYSRSISAFSFANAHSQLRREDASQMASISQPISLVEPVRSSIHSQYETGINFFNPSGEVRSLQPPPETSDRENISRYNSCSSADDDLSIIIKEFGNNSAPEL